MQYTLAILQYLYDTLLIYRLLENREKYFRKLQTNVIDAHKERPRLGKEGEFHKSEQNVTGGEGHFDKI